MKKATSRAADQNSMQPWRRTMATLRYSVASEVRSEQEENFSAKRLHELMGMAENPFGGMPDPRYLYDSPTHTEAKSSLTVGLECGVGFQALIAPPGMGKTTILFDLLDQFGHEARTAFLFRPRGDCRDFLCYLMSELGEVPRSDLLGIQEDLNKLLLKEHAARRRTIVVVDEAQSLQTEVLEILPLLSNFETPSQKLLQIVLAGQPQLVKNLAVPQLKQLHQRISILKTLVPLDLAETENYIRYRLSVAGYRGAPLFTSTALRLVWETSHGVPREINTVCLNALLLLSALHKKQIDEDILREVIADLDPIHSRIVELGNDVTVASPAPSMQKPRLDSAAAPIAEQPEWFSSAHRRFYNFNLNPFECTPDPSFFCLTSTHWWAMAGLYTGILKRNGFLMLSGVPGAGKSLVACCVMKLLESNNVPVEYVVGDKVLPRHVNFRHTHHSHAADAPVQDLNWLQRPVPAVLFIDDSENLSTEGWRELQWLATMPEPDRHKAIVIVGRPEVEDVLASPDLSKLEQTVLSRFSLQRLSNVEIENYVACRLRFVLADPETGPIFTEGAISALCKHTEGNPRLINCLCESALVKGHKLGERYISGEMIEEAASTPRLPVTTQERVARHHPSCSAELLKAAGVLLDLHLALLA